MFFVMKEHAALCHAPLIDMLPVACHQGWSLIVSHSTTLVQVFQELVDCHEMLHKQPCFSSPTIIKFKLLQYFGLWPDTCETNDILTGLTFSAN